MATLLRQHGYTPLRPIRPSDAKEALYKCSALSPPLANASTCSYRRPKGLAAERAGGGAGLPCMRDGLHGRGHLVHVVVALLDHLRRVD